MLGDGQWEGIPDDEGLWLGAEFAQPVQVTTASWDVLGEHETLKFDLEYLDDNDGKWQFVQVLRDELRETHVPDTSSGPPPSTPPAPPAPTTPPSTPPTSTAPTDTKFFVTMTVTMPYR